MGYTTWWPPSAIVRILSNSNAEGDKTMRNQHSKVFKTFFHEKLFRRRTDLGISQDEMANRLEMGCRTYVDLDHGKSGCADLRVIPDLYLRRSYGFSERSALCPRKQRCGSGIRKKYIPASLYRIPLPVTQVLILTHGDTYPICPRCDCTLDREYMCYCDRCGQCLSWDLLDFAKEVHAPR